MTSKSMTRPLKLCAVAALVALAGACTATSRGDDNPVERKFQWFSYLEGGDFKAACGAGGPALYRMIYNAVYGEQVRIYELDADRRTLGVRVIGKADLRDLKVSRPGDMLNPWRGTEAVADLTPAQVDGLVAALERSGAFGPPNVGAELASNGFFWTVAACHDGAYRFTGFQWPGDQWDDAQFPERLFALDPVDVPVNPPRETEVRQKPLDRTGVRAGRMTFHLKVGRDGLAGFAPLF